MKKQVTKFLSMTLALALAMTSVPAFAVKAEETNQAEAAVETVTAETVSGADIVASGSCGNDATYTLDSDGNMVISGTGIAVMTKAEESPGFSGLTSFADKIRTVTIEDGITKIGMSIFSDCTALESVSIPSSVTSIGDRAFEYCTSLESITIPDSVTSIGANAFEYCTSLESITIPDSVTSIGDTAFEYCTSLESISIPNSVTDIGYLVFGGTPWLDNKFQESPFVIINGILTDYDYDSEESNIEIPNGVTSIGENVFSWRTSLESVNISNTVTSIGDGAFAGCTSLKSINIPNSVRSIEYNAFGGCTSLESITIPNGTSSIGMSAFFECTSLKSITIPDSVTSIEDSAFYGCTMLGSITIPTSVTSIGYDAFGETQWLDNQFETNPFVIINGIYDENREYFLCENPGELQEHMWVNTYPAGRGTTGHSSVIVYENGQEIKCLECFEIGFGNKEMESKFEKISVKEYDRFLERR